MFETGDIIFAFSQIPASLFFSNLKDLFYEPVDGGR